MRAYTIKPLEWLESDEDEEHYLAWTAVGIFRFALREEQWAWTLQFFGEGDWDLKWHEAPTRELVKRACEMTYDARMRMSLSPVEAGGR